MTGYDDFCSIHQLHLNGEATSVAPSGPARSEQRRDSRTEANLKSPSPTQPQNPNLRNPTNNFMPKQPIQAYMDDNFNSKTTVVEKQLEHVQEYPTHDERGSSNVIRVRNNDEIVESARPLYKLNIQETPKVPMMQNKNLIANAHNNVNNSRRYENDIVIETEEDSDSL